MMSTKEIALMLVAKHPDWAREKCWAMARRLHKETSIEQPNGKPDIVVPPSSKPPDRIVTELVKILARLRERHPDWNDEFTGRIAARMLYVSCLPKEEREKLLQESEARARTTPNGP